MGWRGEGSVRAYSPPDKISVLCLCQSVLALNMCANRLSTIGESLPFACSPLGRYAAMSSCPAVTHSAARQKSCEKKQGGTFPRRYSIVRHEWRHDLRGREETCNLGSQPLNLARWDAGDPKQKAPKESSLKITQNTDAVWKPIPLRAQGTFWGSKLSMLYKATYIQMYATSHTHMFKGKSCAVATFWLWKSGSRSLRF